MKTLIEKIEKMNEVIAGKQENCRKELIALCEKVCEVTNIHRLLLREWYEDSYSGITTRFYWDNEYKDFISLEYDGYENKIKDTYKDGLHIITKHLKKYLDTIQKFLEKTAKEKEEELGTIAFFETFVENMKKTEESI